MSDEFRKKTEDILIIGLLATASFFILKKAFFILLPVFLGYIFSEMMRSNLKKLSPLSEKAKKVLIILTLLIFFALLSLVLILLFDKTLMLVTKFGNIISENTDYIKSTFDGAVIFVEEKLEKILKRDMHTEVKDYILMLFSKIINFLMDNIPMLIKSIIDAVPKIFISLIIFVFSAYYFSCDIKLLPFSFKKNKYMDKIEKYKTNFILSLKRTVSAYFVIFLITFSELLIGLFILRIPSPFVTAFFISFVDILPILGVGTVLVPWAVFLLIFGKIKTAVGLFILWSVIFLVRQFAEPKIVGKKLGIHPVVSLVAVIAGLYFFGLCGLILIPLAISVIFESIKKEPSQ